MQVNYSGHAPKCASPEIWTCGKCSVTLVGPRKSIPRVLPLFLPLIRGEEKRNNVFHTSGGLRERRTGRELGGNCSASGATTPCPFPVLRFHPLTASQGIAPESCWEMAPRLLIRPFVFKILDPRVPLDSVVGVEVWSRQEAAQCRHIALFTASVPHLHTDDTMKVPVDRYWSLPVAELRTGFELFD